MRTSSLRLLVASIWSRCAASSAIFTFLGETVNCKGVFGGLDKRILIPRRPAFYHLQACGLSPGGKQRWRAPVRYDRIARNQLTRRRAQMAREVFEGPPPRLRNDEVDHVASHQHDVERAPKLDDADVTLYPRHRWAASPGRLQHLGVE